MENGLTTKLSRNNEKTKENYAPENAYNLYQDESIERIWTSASTKVEGEPRKESLTPSSCGDIKTCGDSPVTGSLISLSRPVRCLATAPPATHKIVCLSLRLVSMLN